MFERKINHRYTDPLDLIWIRAANDLGLKIRRSTEVFASYDGNGTLTISEPSDFDQDDCLAQMIFHEICHWLVAGRRGYRLEDWGMSNIDDSDVSYEYAAIRVQATLARPYGLKDFMAVTTDWRPYWDALPEDPLSGEDDREIQLAREAHHLSRLEPFSSVLHRSLSATAVIADLVGQSAPADSLWNLTRRRHRLGSLTATDPILKCGQCAWANENEGIFTCRQHKNENDDCLEVLNDESACEKWEPVISVEDCKTCGACCREGFDVVQISDDDPFKENHRELIQIREGNEMVVPRPNGRCVALEGSGTASSPFRCQHYSTRPRNCEDFEVAGEACLMARRRVGLSR